MQKITIASIIFLSLLSGCAHLDFGDEGLTYYEPKPYLFVTINKDCVCTATPLILPGAKKSVQFKSGYGTADLSLTLSNGMVTTAGQKTDTKIPETIKEIAGLATAATSFVKGPLSLQQGEKPQECIQKALLYPIESGVIGKDPMTFPVDLKK